MSFLSRWLRPGYRVVKEQLKTNEVSKVAYYLLNPKGEKISFWNDVPLNLFGDTVSCCTQIPGHLIAKMQVIKQLPHHPIMQDTRKNKFTGETELRYYAQFMQANYGFIPQTWEEDYKTDEKGLKGDNDPLDMVELGSSSMDIGFCFYGKVLGSFCLIDQGEIDWKILILNQEEAKLNKINTLQDLKRRQAGRLEAIMNWFKHIKTYDGKKPNEIAFGQKVFGKEDTLELIEKQHAKWKKLRESADAQFEERRKIFKF